MAASDTEIPSFSITEKLNESQSFIIYHAIRLKTGEPVILKVLKPQAAAERDENFRFRHEFDITSKINLPGIVKATVLEKYNDSLVMVMCDIGGKSLDCFQLPLTIRQFLEISIAPSQLLQDRFTKGVSSIKSINPSNIVWNPEMKRLEHG